VVDVFFAAKAATKALFHQHAMNQLIAVRSLRKSDVAPRSQAGSGSVKGRVSEARLAYALSHRRRTRRPVADPAHATLREGDRQRLADGS